MNRKQWGPAFKNIEAIRLPSGVWHYRVRMMVAGRKCAQVCATIEEAMAVRDAWQKGGLPSPDDSETPPEPDPTVEDAIRLYELHLRANGQNPHPPQHLLGGLRRHYPELLDLPVTAVHPEDHPLEFRRRRQAGGCKANTIIGNLSVLRAAIKRVRADFHVPTTVFPAPDLTRHRQFTPVEMKAALLATREPAQSIAEIAGVTAMRLSEIRLLRIDAINFTTRTVTLTHTKTGPALAAFGTYAATLLARALERAQARGHVHLFGNPKDRPYHRSYIWSLWKDAMRRLGHGHWTFHDLRHHAAMTALANGASIPELQEFGRWQTVRHMGRYARASADRIRHLQDLGAPRHQAGRGGR